MPAGRRLTAQLQKTLVAYIRQGGYPHMAAEAAGVPITTFESWLAKGNQPGAAKVYRSFADAVRQAIAQARILAETKVFLDDPKTWLKSGPGRDQPTSPGWTTSSPPAPPRTSETNLLADPAWNDLWATVLQAVSAFPEARAALADALQAFDVHGHKRS